MFTFGDVDELNFNYIEVVLVRKEINPYVYDINFSESDCANIIASYLDKCPQYKVFKKHTTKYLYDALEMSTTDNDDTYILHQNSIVKKDILYENSMTFLVNYYSKQSLPSHSFPSTTNVKDVVDSKRVTIKITNNIYLNFESLEYYTDQNKNQYHHVYLNINLNKASDAKFIENTVNDIIKTLTS